MSKISNTLGVTFHSPLDVIALLPEWVNATTEADKDADVFITPSFTTNHHSKKQIVFESLDRLSNREIEVIDCNKNGNLIPLTTDLLDQKLGIDLENK